MLSRLSLSRLESAEFVHHLGGQAILGPAPDGVGRELESSAHGSFGPSSTGRLNSDRRGAWDSDREPASRETGLGRSQTGSARPFTNGVSTTSPHHERA